MIIKTRKSMKKKMSLKCCRLWQGVVPFSEYKNNIAITHDPEYKNMFLTTT